MQTTRQTNRHLLRDFSDKMIMRLTGKSKQKKEPKIPRLAGTGEVEGTDS